MDTGEVFAFVILVILVLASWVKAVGLENKADDPGDPDVVYLDNLRSVARLVRAEHFATDIYRQSGNAYRDQQHMFKRASQSGEIEFVEPSEVIDEVLKTFRRAKIPSVIIEENTETNLSFRRLYHDHRGVKEGRKVFSATIVGGHFGQEFVDAVNTYYDNNT